MRRGTLPGATAAGAYDDEQIKRVMRIDKSEHAKPHILFVCGRNQWRSPTAERIYEYDERIEVRSAGVSEKSRHVISGDDIRWADLILVMEGRYKSRIVQLFRDVALPKIESLDIPDEYQYMDESLIDILRKSVELHINRLLV